MRTVHLLDIENLCRGTVTPRTVAKAWDCYCASSDLQESDHVVVGSGPTAAPIAWFALPGRCRRVLGRGIDGGERAILRAVDPDWLAQHFGRVVIGSGDRLFSELARQLVALGVVVQVVCRPESAGRKLTSRAEFRPLGGALAPRRPPPLCSLQSLRRRRTSPETRSLPSASRAPRINTETTTD